MNTTKPKYNAKRVYLTARDAESMQSKTMTVYDTTPSEVIAAIKTKLTDSPAKQGKRAR